ncbi:peptide ligase PGM1-related protein [Streptosporangium sp. NPDC051023]|uniref:peptide ligase PGM1-related protein n=1 Tax=Streptosporangium sp. NPDC051023 TaxID=3155410 RepID=UPI00344FA016
MSLPQDELRRITGAQCYEERLLFLLLTLRQPGVEIVYLSSAPVDTATVDYYLSFLDDPGEARSRLHMISLDDLGSGQLTESLLRRPDLLTRVRTILDRTDDAWMVPFVVSEHEERLAEILNLPIYGPATALAPLGSKSGGRAIAEAAGVPVVKGFSDLRSLTEVEHAARALNPGSRLMVKLNNSYSGLGNAIVSRVDGPLTTSPTSFSAPDETWVTFAEKIAERGAVLEEFIEERPLYSPSALAMITPGGSYDVVATHEQILGGQNGDVYKGCVFPSRADYRTEVGECAERIAEVLAARGVVGLFGVDFFAVKTDAGYHALLCEINLRIGGTTHPFGAALLTTEATYDRPSGTLMRDGQSKYYVATDNCAAERLLGRTPAEIVKFVNDSGLGFDRERRTGNVLHLLGALPEHGKLGFTSIGNSPDEATELHGRTLSALCQSA